MSGPRKSFYIVLPLFSGLIALLLVEIGLTIFYPIPYSLEINMYFEPDPYTGFRHRPLGKGHYPNGVEAIANSRGHRDDEVEVPKPPGIKRVLLLGDSFAVGANVEQPEAFPQVLEVLLNETSGETIEVVNSGVGGWSAFQYAQYYEYYGDQFEPDLIVIGFFVGNDTYADRFSIDDTLTALMGHRISREKGDGWWTRTRVVLYENSHIARALMQSAGDSSFERKDCGDFNDYFLAVQDGRLFNHTKLPPPEGLELIAGNADQLGRIKKRAATKGVPVLTVILPDENQINPQLQATLIKNPLGDRYDFEMPQSILRGLLDERGITWLDLLAPLKADPRCLYMNDSHWTPAGHRFVAERIRDFIGSEELL